VGGIQVFDLEPMPGQPLEESVAETRKPARRLDLVIGHIVFAPVTAFWLVALVMSPTGSSLAGVIWVILLTAGGMLAPGLFFALSAAYIVKARSPLASRIAAWHAVAVLAGIVSALFHPAGNLSANGEALTRTLFFAAAGWSAYVLVRTLDAWRAPSPSARRRRLAACLVVLLIVVGWNTPLFYYRRQSGGGAMILWKDDKAFLCATRETGASRATIGDMMGHWLRYSRLQGSAGRGEADLMVVEIRSDRFDVHELQDSALWGDHCFIRRDVLYFEALGHQAQLARIAAGLQGYGRERTAWRWNGRDFASLPDDESKEVLGPTTYPTEPMFAEGWKIGYAHAGHPVHFELAGTPVEVRVDDTVNLTKPDWNKGTGILSLTVGPHGEKQLLTTVRDPTLISRGEYLSLPGGEADRSSNNARAGKLP
jgi:hypothetical protein